MANPEDQYARGSPRWWLARLSTRLDDRAAGMARLQAYYDGAQPLMYASPKFRETFGGLFKAFADNFCPLVVDAVEERLNVVGFRVGASDTPGRLTSAQNLEVADKDAWTIWQANQLDAESQKAHTTALIKSESSVIVWAEPGTTDPVITIEDPLEVIVSTAPEARRIRQAALKRWVGDDGYGYATVFLPDSIHTFRSLKPYPATYHPAEPGVRGFTTYGGQLMEGTRPTWQDWAPEGQPNPLPNPLGVVPVISLPNRPRLDGSGDSELTQVLPAQDAINKLAADMLIASEFAAFRQRYALNLDLPVDPDTGRPIEPFKMGVDRLLVVPPPEDPEPGQPEVKMGEFGISDLTPYVRAIEMWVQHIATRTRTPAHYLLGQSGQFPSGESLKATETGLVAKVRRAQRHFGEGWEEVMRLAFLVSGDTAKAEVVDSEVIWADPESRTESEHVDAVTKMGSLGVPQVALWEELGFSPQQIERFLALRAAEAEEAAASFDPFAGLGNGQGAGLGRQAQPSTQPPPTNGAAGPPQPPQTAPPVA